MDFERLSRIPLKRIESSAHAWCATDVPSPRYLKACKRMFSHIRTSNSFTQNISHLPSAKAEGLRRLIARLEKLYLVELRSGKVIRTSLIGKKGGLPKNVQSKSQTQRFFGASGSSPCCGFSSRNTNHKYFGVRLDPIRFELLTVYFDRAL